MDITSGKGLRPLEESAAGIEAPTRSLLWKLVLPTAMAVCVVVAGVAFYTPKAVIDDAIDHAVRRDAITAQELKTLRRYYSDNVVANATKSGTTATPYFKDHPGSIPVPTTFLLEVADAFNSADVNLQLVSPYPWPMRAGRNLDAFQSDAWTYLTQNPDGRYVRRDKQNGGETLRVAIADRMDASCVACHNSNPLSPKKDWKVGDVRGIVEISSPIDTISQEANHLAMKLTGGIIVAGLILLGLLSAIGLHLLRPLRDLARIINQIAVGKQPDTIPHVHRRDELGTVARSLAFLREQTEQRAVAEDKVRHLALHDALTGLANRAAFLERVGSALAASKTDETHAVLYLDLDRFKVVNDTMGHHIGDRLLIEVAKRINGCLAGTDVAGRLGGDEFAVFQGEAAQPFSASRLAAHLIEALQQPFDIDGRNIAIGASVGISLANAADDVESLLKNADLALYRAKTDGRGIFRFFEPEMDARMRERQALEIDLRKALGNSEFEVYYQPQLRLSDNKISGFEALLRWHHPERGMVSPAEFIPLAEEIGVIPAIGAWVLKTACIEAATWPEDIRIAVNLSPLQFQQKTLVLDVVAALDASGLSARRLELEITETVMLQDTGETLAALHQLRELGVKISMDDFGTGYSSLSYLQSFPFDKIKIDQSFIRNVANQANSLAIVRAITGLGASLGMTTTAEGIENEEQLERARSEGCDEIQGYLFGRPKTASDARAFIVDGLAKERMSA